jgi:gamma-glutamyltranspeptidase/glutathione hydrolase
MRTSSPHPQLQLENGCVVSYCAVASAVGTRMLREGGNAVDAAVATALALAVTYPQAGNLGGGGFLLLSTSENSGSESSEGSEGAVHFLDYRETSPRSLTAERFKETSINDTSSTVLGALAVGVPGTVAGLAAALEKFGSFSWDRVVAPAIDLAERGNWLTSRQARYLELYAGLLGQFASTRRYFLGADGKTLLPGTLFCQTDLGRTLRILADEGPRAFYEGRIAEQLVAEIARGHGVLDGQDLAGYQPKWREPLCREFRGRKIYSAPLPSGGGLVVSLSLGLLEALEAWKTQPDSVERLALLGRVFRLSFAVRRRLAGDPDYLDPAQVAEIIKRLESQLSRGELEALEREFISAEPSPSPSIDRWREAARQSQSNTTHFCVLDRYGNAVSNTYSLNTMFGSKLAVDGAGFLLNNCMDDFGLSSELPNWYELVHGDLNHLEPNRRPVSSMSPTLVMRDQKVELIVGGSGGPRIPTLVAQIISSVVMDGFPLEESIRRPRVHHQFLPEELAVERRIAEEVVTQLAKQGQPVVRVPMLGIGAAIHRQLDSNELSATLDTRFSFE